MIKKLFKNTFHYTIINLSGALISFALNFLLVAEYGGSKKLEVYLIVFNLFLVIVTLMRTILGIVFVPKYLEIKSRVDGNPNEFANQILGIVILIGLSSVLLFCIFDDYLYTLIASGSYASITESEKSLYKLFSIYFLFILIYSYFSSIFIANGRVLMGSIYVLFQNATPMIFFFFIHRSISSIVYGHVIISILICLVYFVQINKFSRIRLRQLFLQSEEKKQFLFSSSPVFFSHLLTKIITIYEKSLATTFSLGTVVVLDFSYKLISRFVGIVSSGATISSYPVIVESILEKDTDKLNRIINFSMNTILLVSCSVLSILIVLNNDMIHYIFSIGEMSDISDRFFYPMLFYSAAFIFLNTNDLLRKVCFSYGFVKFISLMNILQVVINVLLILLLKKYLNELSIPLSLLIVLFLYHIVLIIKLKTTDRNIKIYFHNNSRLNIVILIVLQVILSVGISSIDLRRDLFTLLLRSLLIGIYFLFIYGFMFKKIKGAIKNEMM